MKIAVFYVKESFLIRICLAGSVIGIFSIYLLSFTIVAEEVGAGEIGNSDVGRKVRLSGEVDNLRLHSNGHIFFDLKDETGSIDVVIWEDRAEQLRLAGTDLDNIRDGAGIEVTGNVELYRGSVQVVL